MTEQELYERGMALWGLQGFGISYVHVEEVRDRQGRKQRIKVIGLEDQRTKHVCGDCGRRHPEGLFQEDESRRWRDGSVGDLVTYVEIVPWRVACCGGTRVEGFPWEAEGFRMTRRFFERIAALCTRLPIQMVARMAGLSWETVARVDKAAIALALGDREDLLDGLRWIGVDEVSRTGGHVYFTVVTDLVRGRVVWIGDGKGRKGLEPFFEALGPKRCRKIKGVVSDLGTGYLTVIAEYLPRVRHVLDRFHIVQWLNEALNQIRRRVFGGGPTDEVGKAMKVKKWMLLSARERLNQRHKRMLSTLMKANRPLYKAYLLKEQMRGILHHRWVYLGALRRNLEDWCTAAIRSRTEELKILGRRLRKHLEKVVAGFQVAIRMGLVEAINGKISLLRRQAHGYSDVEYFKLKIFQRCSLPDNPWAQIVL